MVRLAGSKETVPEGTLDLINRLMADEHLKDSWKGSSLDLISHRYPLVKPIENIGGIRMLSLNDIAAMKLNAIVGNGTRVKVS